VTSFTEDNPQILKGKIRRVDTFKALDVNTDNRDQTRHGEEHLGGDGADNARD
jgi:hypothetical protein